MQVAIELQRDLVLVGGGHSHALALRMLAMKPIAGLRITLISPSSHTPYSGMLPGLIAGHYSFEQAHIDLARLCQWAGVRFIAGEVTGLDPVQKCLSLAGRPGISYDLVSIDIGSQPELDSVPGARTHATPVKPIAGLWQRWQDLQKRFAARSNDEKYRISVVGGGAGSVELALSLSHSLPSKQACLDLWCSGPEILQGYNTRARRSVMGALKENGINVHLAARVTAVEQGNLVLADTTRAEYDELFWCTGAAAAPWIAKSGLATDEQGFLTVRDTLQALENGSVFGAGDIATQINHPRPKAGVYAVRQGPVLAYNLRAALLNAPLRHYQPQRQFLSLISLGTKQATADRGPLSATGSWVWHWKDRIDRAFMARFEDLPTTMPNVAQSRLPELDSLSQQPTCGGCGAKVGADALTEALAKLNREYPQHCVGGGDDATALPVAAGMPVVQSLDLLRQMVSDPWQMGRIAANHALSDLYACGARPISALAAVTLPYANGALLQRELQQHLAGALHEFAAVNCQLRGGHSMQGPELNLGFVVNGIPISEDGNLLNKSGAVVGDQLLLTKPLGTGTLFAAQMQLAAVGRDASAAIESMLQSNGPAAELAVAHGASACTDVTGFGLLGHLLEMLRGELGARLQLESLPILDGALEQLEAGITSTMHAVNKRSYEEMLKPLKSVEEVRAQIVFDPQTSGGLLIALPAARAAALCSALLQEGYAQARLIGEVTTLAPGTTRPVELG